MVKLLRNVSKIEIIPNFKAYEFFCKCDQCKDMFMDKILLDRLHIVRNVVWLKPMKITSGFRCIKHNKNIGGVNNSNHTIGRAVDIAIPEYDEENKFLYEILKKYFVYVYAGAGYYHCSVKDFLNGGING